MKIIGIELDGNQIRMAELEVSWRGALTLLSCRLYRVEEAEKDGSFKKEIGRADQVIVAYPGEFISSRLLSLPFTQPKKIEQVLPYEIEPLLPFELEKVVLTYHLISQEVGSSRLMVAATPKEEFSRFIEKLHRLGIDPHQVEWDGMALFNFSRIVTGQEKGTFLLINMGVCRTSLCFFREDAPLMIRSLRGGAEDLNEKNGWNKEHFLIKEFFKTVQVFNHEIGASLQGLVVCGAGGEIQEFPEWLAEQLLIPLKEWRIDPGKIKIAPSCFSDDRSIDRSASKASGRGKLHPALPVKGATQVPMIDPLYHSAVGLALKGSSLKGMLSQINFRREEFSHATVEKGKKGIQRTVLIFSLIIFLAGFVDLGVRYSIKKNHYEKVSQQLYKEYRTLFPGSGPIFSEVDQAKGAIIQLKKREAFYGMNGLTPLEVLREMTIRIPKEIKIDVNELSIDPEKIRLEGETDSFDSLDKIKDSLGKNRSFGEIVVNDSKMNAEESKVLFKLEMTRTSGEGKK